MSALTCGVSDGHPVTIDSILLHPHRAFIDRLRIKAIHSDLGVCCILGPILTTISTALGPVGEVLQVGVLSRIPAQADGDVALTFDLQFSHWVWSWNGNRKGNQVLVLVPYFLPLQKPWTQWQRRDDSHLESPPWRHSLPLSS